MATPDSLTLDEVETTAERLARLELDLTLIITLATHALAAPSLDATAAALHAIGCTCRLAEKLR